MIYSILHWQIFMVSVRKIQTRMQTRTKFFNFVASYVFSQEEIQEIQDTPPRIPRDLWLQSVANSIRVWFLSHLLKKTKEVF